jgi:2-methylisocitrate lyase-like PEP mutase family enzyme
VREGLGLQPAFGPERKVDECEVQLAFLQVRDQALVPRRVREHDVDARIRFVQLAEYVGEEVRRDRLVRADPQLCSGRRAELGFGEGEVRLDRARVNEEAFPGFGERQRVGGARPVDELASDDPFEGRELLADGGLRVSEPPSRAVERGFFGKGNQGGQMAHLDSLPATAPALCHLVPPRLTLTAAFDYGLGRPAVKIVGMSAADCRARFRALHERDELFVMPNPWDLGSARLLESAGFEALATTSAGFAWSLGKLDQRVTREELVDHVAALTAATALPVNVDSERCYPDGPGGVTRTIQLLAEAGAAGCSIEDYDPATDSLDDVDVAAARVAEAVAAAHEHSLVLTARAENHIRGVEDLDDTLRRLTAYRDAGADVAYAPGLTEIAQIKRVIDTVGIPLNVLALPSGPSIEELASVGVRRVSTGSALAGAAYRALVTGARELLDEGTSHYADGGAPRDALNAAFEGH